MSRNYHRGDSDGDQAAENSASNNRALTSILNLLETRISIDNEDRQKSAKDAKTGRDWMLAAAVIDRLCFIVLLVMFIGGTLVFFLLFLCSWSLQSQCKLGISVFGALSYQWAAALKTVVQVSLCEKL